MKIISKEDLIIRESMKLPYGGGEIWFEQLDALSVHTDIVKSKFLKDMETLKRPSLPAFIAFNLKETLVDEELTGMIAHELANIGRRIIKVAFVGLDKQGKRCMKQSLENVTKEYCYKFIDDYEKAKEWLIRER